MSEHGDHDTSLHGTAEHGRLLEELDRVHNWKRWGPYLSERQWATVREDYSPNGTCWDYFPHDHARSRAYRWGEDGLLGITDRQCRLCFSLALWNGRDTILKERLFGLTGPEGNHGEDVKEQYFYLDSTPTHSYMKALYKYPMQPFPYDRLLKENNRRGYQDSEFELEDTGIFDTHRYFDVQAEYAKGGPDDILIRITVSNRSRRAAILELLPTVWYRNTWYWGCTHEGCTIKPGMVQSGENQLTLNHPSLGRYLFHFDADQKGAFPRTLFTENETNYKRLFGAENPQPYVKDAFHYYVIHGEEKAVNPKAFGTKAAPHYILRIPGGQSVTLKFRLSAEGTISEEPLGQDFEDTFDLRLQEADEFYGSVTQPGLSDVEENVVRQGYAGLLWTKQFYHYVIDNWLNGDPATPPPPEERKHGRNNRWMHLFSRDIISMPDKWEYPWFAAWDLAFHMIPFARIDPIFAKRQLTLFLREWYMHPNGQIPAYEFAFDDVNPPVHAWAVWRVYKIAERRGHRDRDFLESAFQKLLLNFTWWVNQKDEQGNNLFSGGFLGLDNIGVFDRSKPLPTGGHLQQADGTAWMACYCGTMLAIALELARDGDQIKPAYEDMASKFLEHFVQIADAMNTHGGSGLWDDEDGFYYDQILSEGNTIQLKSRSLVGLLPLIAVEVLNEERIKSLPGFYKRFNWFLKNRTDLSRHISYADNANKLRLLAIPSRKRLEKVLKYLLDEDEFLSPHGIRSLSKFHKKKPFTLHVHGEEHRVDYVPGESNTWLFGGNSNWRGPIWFPVNYILIEALERYHHYYRDDLKVECPTGSGNLMNLKQVADELHRRLGSLFVPDEMGGRPCHGKNTMFAKDPHWKDLVLFHEYFHGDNGKGLGASHQTGWTALSIRSIEKVAKRRTQKENPEE